MTDFTQHLAALGPIAIALGAAFEGQTAVIAGGVIARQQILSPAVVVLAAALGSGIVDYMLFVLGRSFRHTRWVKKVSAKPAFDRALGLIERHPTGFILSFRFLFGLRAAGPVAVGVSTVSTRKFAILNAVAAGIWAGAFVALGYPICPGVTMTQLVASVRAGIAWVASQADALGLDGRRLLVTGHSAGGHLTAMAATGPGPDLVGAVALSGLYDLEPIRLTYLNAALRMDVAEARALSPIHLPRPRGGRVILAVGSAESEEYHRHQDTLAADRKSTRLNSSHVSESRMPSSA